MGNGKVCTSKSEPSQDAKSDPRRGRIKMGIERTLSTAKFEGIVIHYEIDEEITWSDLAERQRKVQSWETVLTKEFQGAHDRILEELKLSHKKAYFKNYLEDKDTRPDPYDGDQYDDLDELDELE